MNKITYRLIGGKIYAYRNGVKGIYKSAYHSIRKRSGLQKEYFYVFVPSNKKFEPIRVGFFGEYLSFKGEYKKRNMPYPNYMVEPIKMELPKKDEVKNSKNFTIVQKVSKPIRKKSIKPAKKMPTKKRKTTTKKKTTTSKKKSTAANSKRLKEINKVAKQIRESRGYSTKATKTYKMSWQAALKAAARQLK